MPQPNQTTVTGHSRVTIDRSRCQVTKTPDIISGHQGLAHEANMTNLARKALEDVASVSVPEALLGPASMTTTLVEGATNLEDEIRFGQSWSGWHVIGQTLALLHGRQLSDHAPAAMPERPLLPPFNSETLQRTPWMALRCLEEIEVAHLQGSEEVLNALPPVRGLIHGDLKPDNILLTADRYHIIDWERGGAGVGEEDLAAPLAALMTYYLVAASRETRLGCPGRNALYQAWQKTSAAATDLVSGYRCHGDVRLDVLNAATALRLFARAQMLAFQTSHLGPAATCLIRAAAAFATRTAGWRFQ